MFTTQLLNYSTPVYSGVAIRARSGEHFNLGLTARHLGGDFESISAHSSINELLAAGHTTSELLALSEAATIADLPEEARLNFTDSDNYKVLPPVSPSQILGVGMNYEGLFEESGMGALTPSIRELPSAAPFWWLKSPHSVVGQGDSILHPGTFHTSRLIPEPELAVVIGRPLGPGIASPKAEDALLFVAGYTVANDVSALDIEFERGGDPFAYNLTWSKSYPTFAPLGPAMTLEGEIDPSDCALQMHVNGELVVDSNTGRYLWGVSELVEYFAAVVRLFPGDIIMCGNHPPTRVIRPGDDVSIHIEGIGTLSNSVAESDCPTAFRVPSQVTEGAKRYQSAKLAQKEGQDDDRS